MTLDLTADARAIRAQLLRMHFQAQSGHIGSGLSCVEILTYLHAVWIPFWKARFVLSKGHAASALYSALHHFGMLPSDQLATYYKNGTFLPAHPVPGALESVPAATGSLGHGLPIAAGMAFASKHLKTEHEGVACLISDGECNEGSTWEAALFAAHHGLNNLAVIIDANGLQGFGRTDEVLNTEPLVAKWKAFGFKVFEVNGHHFEDLHQALTTPSFRKPICVIARTVKGKGVSFMEHKLEWHYNPMTASEFAQAMREVDA